MERTEYYCTLGDNCDGRGNQSEDCKSCKQVRMGDNTGSQVHPNMALPSKQGEETSRLDGGGALFRLLEEHEVTQMILESGIRHLTSNLYHFASGLEARVIAAYSDAAMGLVANTGAAGAGEVKTWRQRAEEGDQDALTGDQCLRLAEQEINDLRAQLARQHQGCETIYQAQYRDRTPDAWIDVSKRQYDLYNERGLGKIPVRILYTTPPSAQQEQGDAVRDAKRWRFSMEFQELARTGASQPEPIKAMWRKVYAERRLHPTREEYEAATDAAIALRATNTGKEQP